jgi:hypothetical protein
MSKGYTTHNFSIFDGLGHHDIHKQSSEGWCKSAVKTHGEVTLVIIWADWA